MCVPEGTCQVLTRRGSGKHQPPLHSPNISQPRQWHWGMQRLHTSWGWRHKHREREWETLLGLLVLSSACCCCSFTKEMWQTAALRRDSENEKHEDVQKRAFTGLIEICRAALDGGNFSQSEGPPPRKYSNKNTCADSKLVGWSIQIS